MLNCHLPFISLPHLLISKQQMVKRMLAISFQDVQFFKALKICAIDYFELSFILSTNDNLFILTISMLHLRRNRNFYQITSLERLWPIKNNS